MFINLNKLNQNILLISSSIKEYETTIYDVLSDIKNTFYYWNDGYTEHFFRNIDKEIQDVDAIMDCLDKTIRFLNNLKSIYYNVYKQQKEIINSSNMVVNSNYFYIRESDEDVVKEKKMRISRLIRNNEDNISYLISRLDNPLIQNILFDNLELSNDKSKKFVGMLNEMSQKISNIQSKYKNFKIYNDRLMNSFNDISNCYNSKNTKNLVKYIENLINNLYIINNNLNLAIEYMVYRQNEISNKLIDKLMSEAYNINEI